jgi:hypothetical protein
LPGEHGTEVSSRRWSFIFSVQRVSVASDVALNLLEAVELLSMCDEHFLLLFHDLSLMLSELTECLSEADLLGEINISAVVVGHFRLHR